jgi:hypothetical protein
MLTALDLSASILSCPTGGIWDVDSAFRYLYRGAGRTFMFWPRRTSKGRAFLKPAHGGTSPNRMTPTARAADRLRALRRV